MNDPSIVVLPQVRGSFLKVIRPQPYQGKPGDPPSPPRFGGSFLFTPNSPEDGLVKKAVCAAIYKAYRDQIDAHERQSGKSWETIAWEMFARMSKSPKDCCYQTEPRTGKDKLSILDGYEGMHYVSAGSADSQPPALIMADGTVVVRQNQSQLEAASKVFQGGRFVKVQLQIWVQVKNYLGIRATLLALRDLGHGDFFAAKAEVDYGAMGAKPPADPFTATGGPLEGDEIPF